MLSVARCGASQFLHAHGQGARAAWLGGLPAAASGEGRVPAHEQKLRCTLSGVSNQKPLAAGRNPA